MSIVALVWVSVMTMEDWCGDILKGWVAECTLEFGCGRVRCYTALNNHVIGR